MFATSVQSVAKPDFDRRESPTTGLFWHRVLRACLIGFIGLSASHLLFAAEPGPIIHRIHKFNRVAVHVVTVDTTHPSITVTAELAAGGPGKSESFRSILRRTRPAVAITGAFFDPRSNCPVGDIAVQGAVVHRGIVGDGLCSTLDGRMSIVSRRIGTSTDWNGYNMVVCGGPTLIRDGYYAVKFRQQGFRDRAILRRNPRAAAGISKAGKLVLVSCNQNIGLSHLASIMKALGCRDAITLDGGSSTGLWYNGKLLSSPSRRLTNVIAVHWVPQPLPSVTASVTLPATSVKDNSPQLTSIH